MTSPTRSTRSSTRPATPARLDALRGAVVSATGRPRSGTTAATAATAATRRGLLALALLIAAALGAAGCTSRHAELDGRRCQADADCPGDRVCTSGVCVTPDARPLSVCQGYERVTFAEVCDDYQCANPRVQEIDRTDCRPAIDPTCDTSGRLITYGPGRCDPATAECVHPTAAVEDCTRDRSACSADDGDVVVERTDGVCDAAAGACVWREAQRDCRASTTSPYCKADVDPAASASILVNPELRQDLDACNRATGTCRAPLSELDCAAELASCDGNTSEVRANNTCANGACTLDNLTRTDCAAPPANRCEGDVLVAFDAGGVCDPDTGRCAYPTPQLIDCTQDVATCDGAVSRIQTNGRCDPDQGRCVYINSTSTDCARPPEPECLTGDPNANNRFLLEYDAGQCQQGHCVYPPPALRDCAAETFRCNGDFSERRADGACVGDSCVYPDSGVSSVNCTLAAAPTCVNNAIAQNTTDGGLCDATSGRCDYSDVVSTTFCPTTSYCSNNSLFRPNALPCNVRGDFAECSATLAEDCSVIPAPTCDGDVLVEITGPGLCDALADRCDYAPSAERTGCARCDASSGDDASGPALCVLPGTRRVPAGEILAGDGATATVTGPFALAETELTRGQVRALVRDGLLGIDQLPPPAPACTSESCPVVGVSWLLATRYANAMSARDGLDACYDQAGRVVGGDGGNPSLCAGWRLPTEAEWALANADLGCDPGAAGCIDAVAWHADNTQATLQPVATAGRNALGLADMLGNAREWVHDAYAGPAPGGRDPYGRALTDDRVLRGGSFLDSANDLSLRAWDAWDARPSDAGVRLARSLAPQPAARCLDDTTLQRFLARGQCDLSDPDVPCTWTPAQVQTLTCPAGCLDGQCLVDPPLTLASLRFDGTGAPRALSHPIVMRAIPGGASTLGTPSDPDSLRTATLSHDFWIMDTELTREQFNHLLPSRALNNDRSTYVEILNALGCDRFDLYSCPTLPAFGYVWRELILAANALSRSEGLPPCYDDDGYVIDGGPDANPYACEGYRLPTAAEWEKAYRAGTSTRFACGDDPACLLDLAWFLDNSLDIPPGGQCPPTLREQDGACPFPRDVAQALPNAWGLYDMAGNASEWIHDWTSADPAARFSRDPYTPRPPLDQVLPSIVSINRGGSWFTNAQACSATAAQEFDPSRDGPGASILIAFIGGRLARTAPTLVPPTVTLNSPAQLVSTDGAFSLSRGFMITSTEINQRAWRALMGSDPARFDQCGADTGQDGLCPVERVSWVEAARFANALSRREGLRPCYDDAGNVTDGGPSANPYACEGWRLPTEAEWELAARAGASTTWTCGNNAACLATRAHYLCTSDAGYAQCDCGNEDLRLDRCGGDHAPLNFLCADPHDTFCLGTAPAGSYPPNAYGLYDTTGNVAEWTHDAAQAARPVGRDPYTNTPQTASPLCTDPGNNCRVVRGGSWLGDATAAQLSARQITPAGTITADIGFRLVRTLPE